MVNHDKLFHRLGCIKRLEAAGDENASAQRLTLKLQPVDRTYIEDRDDIYRYQWQSPPWQTDPVIRLIIQVIRELNQENCLFAAVGVNVWNTDLSPPIWPPNPFMFSHCQKLYTFTQEKQEFPLTVRITIIPACGPLFVESIYVQQPCSKVWMPLKNWLLTIPDIEAFNHPLTPFELTRRYWRRNGRAFRLMDLPAEIRNIIFEYALGPEIHPLSNVNLLQEEDITARQNARIVFGIGRRNRMMRESMPPPDDVYLHLSDFRGNIARPSLALLQTSKQVCLEVLEVGWEATTKYFMDLQVFANVADSRIGPAVQYNCLRKIQLDFTHAGWLKFFGARINSGIPVSFAMNESESKGHYLGISKLPKLSRLEMRFYRPVEHRDDQWDDQWHGDSGHELLSHCQSVFVDMICTFAYPFVKHIRHIKLMGFVKKETKTKWENIYAGKRDHDQEYAMSTIPISNHPVFTGYPFASARSLVPIPAVATSYLKTMISRIII
ncbi:hypothetical protein P280DRAFT_269137 [Massarina eburnea CBS 473.64]|uniref:F-box domain-containing protein n=1 Tax=Massarina eburnea CBS 473.64 TaxID=1395130 RepID=A0A6A6S6E8_9PLEO|nr:hypothetical protein P280DRAFT_269137 [Massarina eburnea CBS 473.64]